MKQFEKIKIKPPKKSVFDLSHELKMSTNIGTLTPVFLEEVVPGDKFRVTADHLVRFQPMISPVMHRFDCFTEFFYVPYRLIWDDAQKFFGAGGSTGDAGVNLPRITGTGADWHDSNEAEVGSLSDHLGIPVQMIPDNKDVMVPVSQLPYRAYWQVVNDYYLDSDMVTPMVIPKDSLARNILHASIYPLLGMSQRAWEKDYFTSARPTAQRGAPVKIPSNMEGTLHSSNQSNDAVDLADDGYVKASGSSTAAFFDSPDEDSFANQSTINDLRTASALQRWLEKTFRGGGRFNEYLLSVFGVQSDDLRIGRAKYLGGGKMPLMVSEVLQTGQGDDLPQGNMSGHGLSAGRSAGFEYSFKEHGVIIGLFSVRPRSAYFQGIPRQFLKTEPFDFLVPDFANLGEQPVLAGELYMKNLVNDKLTFGYQRRYCEYTCRHDTVHGDFRTNLNYWHAARIFGPRPHLNGEFLYPASTPVDRIFAVQNPVYDKVLVQLYFNCKAARPLPYFGVPI